MKIKTISDIVSWRLCVGCGACAYICKNRCIELRDVPDQGIRPFILSNQCGTCSDCLQVCPGYATPLACNTEHAYAAKHSIEKGWGPIIEIWEGYARDDDLRYQGSSGGVTSALALYCLEKMKMHGVLHIGGDGEHPTRNRVFTSMTRADLLSRTGSRYSPASPCAGLGAIASASSPCAFIGKPCDIAGLRKTSQLQSVLNNANGLAIGIFCAGTPSSKGTQELLKKMEIRDDLVQSLQYRGRGWPGMFKVELKDGARIPQMPYTEAWDFLQKYRPYRCYLCPDGTAAFSDISCGDPWHRSPDEHEPGYSLVLVRTKTGKDILDGAIKSGYISMERVEIQQLIDSQESLLQKRREIWGRLFMMKIFGIPVPDYSGFFLFDQWCSLSFDRKIRSLFGTARRIVERKYYRPLPGMW